MTTLTLNTDVITVYIQDSIQLPNSPFIFYFENLRLDDDKAWQFDEIYVEIDGHLYTPDVEWQQLYYDTIDSAAWDVILRNQRQAYFDHELNGSY